MTVFGTRPEGIKWHLSSGVGKKEDVESIICVPPNIGDA